MNFFSTYSLNHCRKVLQSAFSEIKKHRSELSETERAKARQNLKELEEAIQRSDKKTATVLAKELEQFCSMRLKKPWWRSFLDVATALLIALIIATIIRQSWFELYEIPTGSMRPTFKEQDHLTVSKTQFGINIPLETAHYCFDPDLIKRAGIIIFTGDKLPFIDSKTNFLGIFPYTKRYVKRLIGKPGDTLYFYGGKIYGIDKDGNEIKELIDNPALASLEHIPFISFSGNPYLAKPDEVIFRQSLQPIARLKVSPFNELKGDIYNGKEWVNDDLSAAKAAHHKIVTLSDIWGMGNFAMAKLLNKDELTKLEGVPKTNDDKAALYLVLWHHPSMNVNEIKALRNIPIISAFPRLEKSVIPLTTAQLDALMDNMYTARFVIQNGKAKRYSHENSSFNPDSPRFEKVDNGTYEFYFGKASKILFAGFAKELPKDSPLYSHDPENIKKLFNLGISMDRPDESEVSPSSNRYAYFRDGDLYLLGAPILKKEDPNLKEFISKEKEREASQTYLGFIDRPPPFKEGKIDKEFIKAFGLTIPAGNYFVLGDNHAMSGDSRAFGFVPATNLQGVPEFVIWPKTGFPAHQNYPTFVAPRLIVWSIAAILFALWYIWNRRRLRKPIHLDEI